MPNHLRAADAIETAVNAGVLKAHMSLLDMLVRGMYAGFFAGITASFTYQLTAYTGNPTVGGLASSQQEVFMINASTHTRKDACIHILQTHMTRGVVGEWVFENSWVQACA